MIEEKLMVETDDGPMTTLVWRPEADSPLPCVILYHDGPGLRDDMYEAAELVAREGYYVALPDLYHRSGPLLSFDFDQIVNDPEGPEGQRVVQVILETSVEMMASDTYALLGALEAEAAVDARRAGVVGICHTARAAIRVMAEKPDTFTAGSMIHPSFCVTDGPGSPHLEVARIRGAVFAAFGGEDPVAPLDQQRPLVEELERPAVNATIHVEPGVGHGYIFRSSPGYSEEATERTWRGSFEALQHVAGDS